MLLSSDGGKLKNLSAKQFWALMDRNLTASNQVVRATTCWHRELDRIMEF